LLVLCAMRAYFHKLCGVETRPCDKFAMSFLTDIQILHK